MRGILLTLIAGILICNSHAMAQVRVAIVDFENKSDRFHLESWERLVPDLLRNELSASEDITLVTRDRLETVLKEQALLLSGVIDPGKVTEVGRLLDAEFIITGSILEINSQIRLSAEIIRVKTGQILTESVQGSGPDHLEKMAQMLGNNLLYQLTGKGTYIRKIRLQSRTFWYFLGASAAFATGAYFSQRDYRENWDSYTLNERLQGFDRYYDRANTSRKWSLALTSLTAVSLTGSLISWLQNQNAPTIQAGPSRNISCLPIIDVEQNYGYKIGISLHF